MTFGMKQVKRDAHIELSVFKHPIVSKPATQQNSGTILLSVFARVTPSRLQIVSSAVLQQHTTGWVRFNGLTISNSPSSLKLVIVARNTSNNQTVDLQDIGMIADNELSAILVAYSNATDDMAERMKSAIIESASKGLTKREAGGSGGAVPQPITPTANSGAPCITPPLKPCRLVPYNVSVDIYTFDA